MPRGGEIVIDPTTKLPAFTKANRKQWVTANRILSKHGRTASSLYKWGLRDSPICPECHNGPQDTDHIILHCPATRLPGGYNTIFECNNVFTDWVSSAPIEMWRNKHHPGTQWTYRLGRSSAQEVCDNQTTLLLSITYVGNGYLDYQHRNDS